MAVLFASAPAWSNCVDLPTSRYELRGAEAYDTVTHLIWARCSIGQAWDNEKGCVGTARKMTYDEALQMAVPPWRLPRGTELLSIMAFCHRPAINAEVFSGIKTVKEGFDPDFPYQDYWSFSGKNDKRPFVANFYIGGGTLTTYKNRAALRLVRSEK